MMEFFNFIGGIFGYILWGAFFLVKNFGIAIMIFTIIIKLIMFPLSVKQQKSMAANARFQAKQQEILKKYKNNLTNYFYDNNEQLNKIKQILD